MKDLRGRVAAVTGAASGIGRALAIALAREGCHVALADIDEGGLAVTARKAEAHGVKVTAQRLDVADRAAVDAWAGQVVGDHGCVNLLFNNAGVALAGNVDEMDAANLEWLLGVNLWGVLHGTRAFLPHLRASGEGHVVNVSSVFGLIAMPTQSAYNVAKFGVRGLTEALRMELAIEGAPVSATCVHPGGVRTNIVHAARLDASGPEAPTRDEITAEFERAARTSPERAAQKILRGVRRDAARVLVGADAWLIDRLQRWLPTGYQRLIVWATRRRLAKRAAELGS